MYYTRPTTKSSLFMAGQCSDHILIIIAKVKDIPTPTPLIPFAVSNGRNADREQGRVPGVMPPWSNIEDIVEVANDSEIVHVCERLASLLADLFHVCVVVLLQRRLRRQRLFQPSEGMK